MASLLFQKKRKESVQVSTDGGKDDKAEMNKCAAKACELDTDNNNNGLTIQLKSIRKSKKQRTTFSFMFTSSSWRMKSGSFSSITEEYSVPRGGSLEADLSFGAFATVGRRKYMEDRYEIIPFVSRQKETTTLQVNEIQSDECSPMIEDEVILCSKQPQLASVTGKEEEYNLDKTVPPLSPPEKRMSKGKATKNHAFFAIYDGHGGSQAAECALKHTHKNVINSKYFETDPEAALMEAFAKTESDYLKITEEQKLDGLIGTTVCVALITGNVLYVANAGDSGAVLYKDGGTIVRLTNAHTPENPGEAERVQRAGGIIVNETRLGHPVWNSKLINLGVTRSLGDAYFKLPEYTGNKPSGLIAEPEIMKTVITKNSRFLIMGSDGLWEVLTPSECVEFVLQHTGEDPTWVCEELTKLALKKTPYPDNITVVLVNFQSNGKGQH